MGGGIAGLTLAIALAKYGIPSHILERREAFSEAGAGIQIGPNASRILHALGVSEHLADAAATPKWLNIRDAMGGETLATFPLGDWIAARHGAPYWVMRRQDLHAALLKTASEFACVEIEMGRHVWAICEDQGQAEVRSHDGRVLAKTDMAIGADGIWSKVRDSIGFDAPCAPSGLVAARKLISTASAPEDFRAMVTGLWLGKDIHVVHYPVNRGRDIAIVAIFAHELAAAQWSQPIAQEVINVAMARVASPLKVMLDARTYDAGPEWQAWPLYQLTDLPQWHLGRTVLIGDAAHPVLPYFAQGGAMAIEDAYVLANSIAMYPAAPTCAIEAYFSARSERVRRVRLASISNGKTFHASGIHALARNATMRTFSGEFFMKRYDWLYGWRADLQPPRNSKGRVDAA